MNFDFWTQNTGETPDDVPYINLLANTLKANNVDVKTINGVVPIFGEGLTNPLTTTLDANAYDIVNVANMTVENISSATGNISVNANLDMNLGAIFNAGTVNTSVFNAEQLYVTNKIEMELTGRINNTLSVQTDELRVSSILSNLLPLPTTLTIATTEMKLDATTLNMANSPIINVNSLAGVSTNNISMLSNVDMNSNNLLNVGSLTTRQINGITYVRSQSDLPLLIPSGTYVICGQILLTGSYTTGGDVSFFGGGTSELRFTGTIAGVCFTTTNHNLSFNNVKISNTSTASRLFNGSNIARTTNLSFTNCIITDCKNEMFNINGYNIVDFNHTNFIYNYPTALHLYIGGCKKLIVDGCNFSDSYQLTNPTVYGTANLIDLYGSYESILITNTFISPTQTQTGLFIADTQTSQYTLITANSFTNSGLTTGQLVSYTLSLHPELAINTNNIASIKAILEGSVINNTTPTATVINQYVAVDWGAGFTVPTNIRFATTAVPFEFKYIGERPISCSVVCSVGASQNTGGDDTILFGIFKNNAIGVIVQTSIEQNTVKSFTYSTILNLVKNDLLQFRVQNTTAGTNVNGFRGEALNATLVEV